MHAFPRVRPAIALLTMCILSACGGGSGAGSGGASAPQVPAQPPVPTYFVSGSIAGLRSGGMTLSLGTDTLAIAAGATTFTMPTALPRDASYNAVISAQPPRFTQRCTVANGSGTIGNANVSNVSVACINHPALVGTLAGTNNPISQISGYPSVFAEPQGVATDEAGNVYVADYRNGRIAKVTPDGTVTTFAGRIPGQVPTAAELALGNPQGIARDKDGNFYLLVGHMVKQLSKDGTLSNIAGATEQGYADGVGAQARFNTPLGIAIDGAGNLFVADTQNLRIRKITAGGVVTTVAGNGARGNSDGTAAGTGFNNPYGVTVDKAGNLFVTDTLNQQIIKISPTGVASVYAGKAGDTDTGDGPGPAATLQQPMGITIDNDGNLYVAEARGKIRIITPNGYVSTIAGHYPVTAPYFPNSDGAGDVATFNQPQAIAVDAAGKVYVADRQAGRIRLIVEQ